MQRVRKRGDYLLWREVVLILKSGQHLSIEGLQAIINIRASINLGLSENLKTAFPDTVPVLRPIIEKKNPIIPDPEWVAGFTTGEGCFFIENLKSKNTKSVETVSKICNYSTQSRSSN